MAVLKCQSCGAALEIADDRQYIKCGYCGAVNVNEYFDVGADILQESLPTTESLLERAFMFLEDGEYSRADQYFERVLDIEPKCADAYVGKLMAEMFCRTKEDLAELNCRFDDNDNYYKSMRFGDSELKEELQGYTDVITGRIEINRLEGIYNKASVKMNTAHSYETLVAANSYQDAAVLFESIVDYKDSAEKARECRQRTEECLQKAEIVVQTSRKKLKIVTIVSVIAACAVFLITLLMTQVIIPDNNYRKAEEMLLAGNRGAAAIAFGKMGDYKDAREWSIAIWYEIREDQYPTLAAGMQHIIGLTTDKTVIPVGDSDNSYGQCNVSDWADIVAVAAGDYHTVGLRDDGTVVAVGYNRYGQCNVSGWSDIVYVEAFGNRTLGIRSDGTVIATGDSNFGSYDVSGWRDLIFVTTGMSHAVGLRFDGTVVSTGYGFDGQCDVEEWTDIISLAAGNDHTVGLKSDGTVVATGDYLWEQTFVNSWTDIIAVAAGDYHTVGLRSDGTVVATGANSDGRCDVSGWTDIVAVVAGTSCTVGLRSDGTVIIAGYD